MVADSPDELAESERADFAKQMLQCRSCGIAPEVDGRSYLMRPPGPHSLGKVQQALSLAGCAWHKGERPLELVVDVADHERLAEALVNSLSPNEQSDTMIMPGRYGKPDLDEIWSVMRLSDYAATVRGQWLVELIEDGRLTTFMQPIVDADLRPIGHECLIRGQGHDGELISPGSMLSAASTPRLAAYFDRAARLTAVAQSVELPADQWCFINFLPSVLYEPENCLRTTVAALKDVGIDPGRVVFEVVETEAMDDIGHLRRIVDYYRNNGFRVALDDFGAGYNNLTQFVKLRPDFIKIDKALTLALASSPLAHALTSFLIQTAKDNDIKIIAEGVEDAATFATLKDMGTDYFQGFYFAKPAPEPVRSVTPADEGVSPPQ